MFLTFALSKIDDTNIGANCENKDTSCINRSAKAVTFCWSNGSILRPLISLPLDLKTSLLLLKQPHHAVYFKEEEEEEEDGFDFLTDVGKTVIELDAIDEAEEEAMLLLLLLLLLLVVVEEEEKCLLL
jgi:hypothetical protein